MDSQASVKRRIEQLEASLRRMRRVIAALVLVLAVGAATAFVAAEDEVKTPKLTLMNGSVAGVSLVAGSESSLVIQDPTGAEIMRIGGHPLRLIGEDEGGGVAP
jgi:hypothetical protein